MSSAASTAIDLSRVAGDELPWLPYSMIPGSSFKILKVEESTNTVVLRFNMAPHTVTPRHAHHCQAMAYTLSGVWYYDHLTFRRGDLAFENDLAPHQPVTRDEPAELLTTFVGGRGNDRLLEEYPENGPPYLLRTRFFKALEGITPEQLARLDLQSLLG